MADRKEQMAVCFVHCERPVSTRLLHLHHVIPQGFGGPDTEENTVWLCASCHDVLHRLAQYSLSKKIGLAQDLAMQHIPHNPKARQRLWSLVSSAANAQETFIPEAGEDNAPVIVSLHMSRELHGRLKILAGEHTHAKSGRRVGLYRYCLEVLQAHVDAKLSGRGDKAFDGPSTLDPQPFFARKQS